MNQQTPPRLHAVRKPPAKRSLWQRLERRMKPNGVLDTILAGLVIVGVVVAGLAVVTAFVLLGGLIFYLAWNLGVVGVVAAAGGSVSKIGFWTAVGASLFLGIIKGVLSAFGRTTAK